jgi:nucleoid-associated protein EbfC
MKGKIPGGMPGNMNQMMKQVQKMQRDMEKTQQELEEKVYETSAGGGAIHVKVNGKKELLEIRLEPSVVDPNDIEMLQDLILVAVNEALKTASEDVAQEMGRITGGVNIPGLF